MIEKPGPALPALRGESRAERSRIAAQAHVRSAANPNTLALSERNGGLRRTKKSKRILDRGNTGGKYQRFLQKRPLKAHRSLRPSGDCH